MLKEVYLHGTLKLPFAFRMDMNEWVAMRYCQEKHVIVINLYFVIFLLLFKHLHLINKCKFCYLRDFLNYLLVVE